MLILHSHFIISATMIVIPLMVLFSLLVYLRNILAGKDG